MAENKEEKDYQSYKKLCQIWGVLKVIENDDVYNRFLDKDKVNKELETIIKTSVGDVNYQFSSCDSATLCNPELAGYTALHLVAGRENEVVEVMMSREGIDFTIKNYKGSTALHEAIRRFGYYYNGRWHMWNLPGNRNANIILSAHVKLNVSENPCSKRGVSHFHIACAANNVRTVEFFINKGVSVNQIAVGDFSFFFGYTPLHFAVHSNSLDIVDLLLRDGADIHKKDARGMSSVHLLLEEKMTIDNIKTMETLLRHIINSKNRLKFDSENLSLFDIACTLENTTLLEQILIEVENNGHCVEMDSTFAAYFDSKILRYLLQNEMNIQVKDANGFTPFDSCLERYKVQDLHSVISANSVWRDILLLDNKSKLPDIIFAMKDSDTLANFLKDVDSCESLRLPNDSPLWPGYTLLHLAVNLLNNVKPKDENKEWDHEYKARIEVCLKHGADVTVQDVRGRTAVHLAYRLQKYNAVMLLLNNHTQIVNPIDEDNLSHLYIACVVKTSRLVEKLLSNDNASVNLAIKSTFERRNCEEPDFFVTAGSTPLHAAVTARSAELVKILMEHGANINAKDSNGVTPLHCALACEDSARNVGRILLSSPNVKESSLRGLNGLHLAVEFRSEVDVIERFIELGADVNSAIDFNATVEDNLNSFCMTVKGENRLAKPFAFMSKFNKCTPIDIAIHHSHREVVKILLNRGVNIFAVRPDRLTLVHKALRGCFCDDLILSMIKCDVTLQQRMLEETGITMLHIACKNCNIYDVEYYLKNETNVNAQVKFDSPLWPGYTAMHVLAVQAFQRSSQEKIQPIAKLLLEYGADLTLMNSEKNTPMHDSFTYDLYSQWPITEPWLRSKEHFNVYPTDAQGLSIFHVACLRIDLAVMKRFLKCNVNVNQPVGLHSDKFPGFTPLHLVLHPDSRVDNDLRLEAIDLLIKQGATADATDLYGNTLFHAVTKCPPSRIQLMEKIFSVGTSISAKNIFGEEPFGLLLGSRKFEYAEVKFFLDHNCHANIYDPVREEGYLQFLFGRDHPIKKMVRHPSITTIDDFGRNAIHNVVSWNHSCIKSYYQIIPMLMERGCNIDQQDKLGRTPLHLAVKFSNGNAVIDLLGAGADINLTDAEGYSPFSRIFSFSENSEWHQYEFSYRFIYTPLAIHVHKLQITRLFVSDLNAHTLKMLLKKCSLDQIKIERANNELTKIKNMIIESTQLSPYDFFSETGAIAAYPYLSVIKQQAIDKFFTSIKKRDFGELGYLLKIRHEKAIKRLSLLMPAKIGLDRLLKCALPEKCSQHILRFLSNTEIENVNVSVNLIYQRTYRKNLEKMLILNKKLKCI